MVGKAKVCSLVCYSFSISNSLIRFPFFITALQSLNIGKLPKLRHLTLRTHDIEALCQTTTRFLSSHPRALEVLNLTLVPIISGEWSYDEAQTMTIRSNLREYFVPKLTSKVMLLNLGILSAIGGHTGLDSIHLSKAQDLSVDMLPDWENLGKLRVEILRREPLQEESLERIYSTIWGWRAVPYKFGSPSRIGTL
jgi:hypothetical protein